VDTARLAVLRGANIMPARFDFPRIAAYGGAAIVPVYAAGVTILHPNPAAAGPRPNLTFRTHEVYDLMHAPLGYDALIGRDILNRCVFVNDGPAGTFTFAY
jgi:hypothetical protein